MSYNTCDTCTPCTPAPTKPKLSEMTNELTKLLVDIDVTLSQILGLVSNAEPNSAPFTEPCCIAENAHINLCIAKCILDKANMLKEDL